MKLSSLSMFFPFYNDEGTVLDLISKAYEIGDKVSNRFEVIAIHGGNSKDKTLQKIYDAKKKFPDLIVINKENNTEGYAVIKHGFKKAQYDWVFYTDGDAQYDISELKLLVAKQHETSADVVNGYKTSRGDGIIRHILGDLYARISSFIFELKIRDTDCDFRLIKNEFLKKFDLVSTDSSILGELIKKLEIYGATFAEIPVSHFKRQYGSSNYSATQLFWEKLVGDIILYNKFRKLKNCKFNLRIIKFGAIGISSILIQFTLFNIIIVSSKIPPFFASILSDQVSIFSSFLLNNRYTFHDKKINGFRNKLKPFGKFYSIVILTTIIQATIILVGNTIFGQSLFVSNIFFVIGLLVSFVINFTLQKRLVWTNKI